MSTKTKVILAAVALVSTYAFGRYTAPTKTVTEIKTVEVEKKQSETDTERNRHKRTETHEVTKPDGSKDTTTTVTEDTNTERKNKSTDDTTTASDSKVTVEYIAGKLSVSALIGFTISGVAPVYGMAVSTQVLGPITSGVWGMSNGVLGVSIGLAF